MKALNRALCKQDNNQLGRESIMDLAQVISAAGIGGIIGSLVTTLIQEWFSNKRRISRRDFQEKKAAYIGLLEAYHLAAIEGTDEAAKNFAFWQMRCEIVSPPNVRNAIQSIIETNENIQKRHAAHDILKEVLRKDLNIETN
jgi:hypothetical protein